MAASLVPSLTGWLITYLLHSSVLLLGAWGLARWLPDRPRLVEVIWRSGLITPVVTATISFALGGGWASSAGPAATLWLPPLRPAPALDWMGAVVATWLLVGIIGLAGLLRSRIRLTRLLASRRPAGAAELQGRIAPGFLSRGRLTVSPDIASPVALGLRELCLPEAALVELSDEELRAVLAHELAHLERRDGFWLPLANLLPRALWFQPLNWLARRRLHEAAEFLCDERAAERSSPIAFASALTTVSGWTTGRPALGIGLVSGESLALRRVRRILAVSSAEPMRPGITAAYWVLPLTLLSLFGPRIGVAVAPTGRYVISAFDNAGPFTITMEAGRVVGATMNGAPISGPAINQSGRRVRIVDPEGRIPLELTVTPRGGLAWKSRPRTVAPGIP